MDGDDEKRLPSREELLARTTGPDLDWLMGHPLRWQTFLAGYQSGIEEAAGERAAGFEAGFLAGRLHELGVQAEADARDAAEWAYWGGRPAAADPYAEEPVDRAMREREAARWDAGEYGDVAGGELVDTMNAEPFADDDHSAGAA